MKKLKILIGFLLLCVGAQAQQDALFSQYMFNMMLVNPAYTGSRDVISLNAMYRKQWLNVEGAPQTATFSADMPFRNEDMGAGLVVYNDRIGLVNNTGFYANYSYRIHLTNKATLAMGLSAGLTNYHASFTRAVTTEGGDPAFSRDYTKMLPNVGAGLFYSTDKFYVGLSVPHAVNNRLGEQAEISARQYRHIFLTSGYVFPINHHFKIKPSIMIKQVSGAPIQMDVNANLWIYDRYAVGLSYRSLDAPVFIAEMQLLEQLRLGYAFDYSHTRLRKYNIGSHELLLRYEFGYDKGKMLTPRYF